MMAFIPEAHTLFTVVQTVEEESPAPSAHCLAGFCPKLHTPKINASIPSFQKGGTDFAERTFPKKTSSTAEASMAGIFSRADLMAWDPNWVAVKGASELDEMQGGRGERECG
jgi:hypothetical protein